MSLSGMDANTREKVLDALVKYFTWTGEKRCPWDEDRRPEDIAFEVKEYFEGIESRLNRLEHPLRD